MGTAWFHWRNLVSLAQLGLQLGFVGAAWFLSLVQLGFVGVFRGCGGDLFRISPDVSDASAVVRSEPARHGDAIKLLRLCKPWHGAFALRSDFGGERATNRVMLQNPRRWRSQR